MPSRSIRPARSAFSQCGAASDLLRRGHRGGDRPHLDAALRAARHVPAGQHACRLARRHALRHGDRKAFLSLRPQRSGAPRAADAAPGDAAPRHEAEPVEALSVLRLDGQSALRPARRSQACRHLGPRRRHDQHRRSAGDVLARRRAPLRGPVLRGLVPRRAAGPDRLSRLGHGFPEGVPVRARSAIRRRQAALGGRRGDAAHINSDITMSDSEIIFCNGASQTIVAVDLQGMRKFRIIDERPDFATALEHPRQAVHQVYDSLARGNFFGNSQHFLGALRISRFTLMDSVYGCQLSNDQSLLFTANRGLNHITIYDYPSAAIRLRGEAARSAEIHARHRPPGRSQARLPSQHADRLGQIAFCRNRPCLSSPAERREASRAEGDPAIATATVQIDKRRA